MTQKHEKKTRHISYSMYIMKINELKFIYKKCFRDTDMQKVLTIL